MRRGFLLAIFLLLVFSMPASGDFVDSATGYFIYSKTDLQIPGLIPVNITRYYLAGATGVGTFGTGTYFEYDWWLGAYGADGNINSANPTMFLLVKPGNYQYRFDIQQANGTFINDRDPDMSGAVVTKNPDYSRTLRMRNGWTYKFNVNGRLIEIADRNGNKLTLTRRSAFEGEYLTEITTPEGRKITFNHTYTWAGGFYFHRTDKIVDHVGREVTYSYDSSNRLKTVTYPDGDIVEYQYDSSGKMTGIKNESGVLEVVNEYNSDNRVTRQTQPDGGTFTFAYTVAGGFVTETAMTAPNGGTSTWRFNSWKYMIEKTIPDGKTIYEREPATNRLLSVTDPLGRKTTYTYYSTTDVTNGLVKTVTDSLGNVTSYAYETKYGLPTQITDALGKITTFTYTFDANNKLTKTEIKDPLLNLTTINYNANGMPSSIKDPNNNTTTFLYEDTSNPAELTKITDPLGNATKMTYDSAGRLATTTDATGATTTYGYNVMDRVQSVTDALGILTRYFYDTRGNLVMVIDGRGNMIQYQYDDRDRVVKMIDQLGREETYTYYRGAEITATTGDNLKSITDRKGQVTTFNQYDTMNRLKKVTYNDNSTVQYVYDTAGRVTSITDSISGAISYTYNDFGCTTCSGRGMDKISKEVVPLGTIDYTYDKAGRRLTMTVAGQPVASYVYDAAGRMTSISRKIGSSTRTYNLTYDAGSRRTSLKAPVSTKSKYVTTTYSPYDAANNILGMLVQGPSAQIENLVYQYDPNGNRAKFTRNATQPIRDGVTNTTYDDANELLSFTPAAGSAKNMSYDNNGNLLTVTNSCGTTTYTWDARNRLAGIAGYKPDCTTLSASFKYDALGRRIEKTINGTTTKYLYDGLDIIQEKNQSGTVTANYIRTLNIDEPLTRVTGSTVRHYVKDALGSIIALTDDTGIVKTTYRYDPFGNVTTTGEASDNPLQYTGRENDGTGLYYYRARYYSPDLQRFISEDPISFIEHPRLLMVPKLLNLYVYALNNPLTYIDDTGKAPKKKGKDNGTGSLCFSKMQSRINSGTCPDWTDCFVCCGDLMPGMYDEAILICTAVCEEALDKYKKNNPDKCKCK